ncbi:hypothetical protein SCP_0800670 [Sparassis crispa]|uniref:Phospholipid/glycerol acyltransferase domain-containing protein n=1 Tax=Sparassis crispa TaxID=139825 RepID=A0A401GTN5_9APHY|nr:hypothetical protein SCP_0800670 [Sparassis crispa]GBE85550.1 hypothetical protein SCP_0800670 [Sparassis crispa]
MIATTTSTPWAYFCVRFFLRLVLNIFYGNIVVENTHLIPGNGEACIVCANHDNSVTDAAMLLVSIPQKRRSMLRVTAKSTHFGKTTFVAWLISLTGAVPVKRRVDFANGQVDNSEALLKLVEALEVGEAVGFFPEGVSRYSSALAPMRSGVGRLVSQVLSRNRNKPDFEISILPCSITYMNRQHFRSDVLVSFQPPMKFKPKDHPELLEPIEFNHIRRLTAQIEERVGAGTLHAPSWKMQRNAKMAAQLYAPLGTTISLGDHVRTVKIFLEAFKSAHAAREPCTPIKEIVPLFGEYAKDERDKVAQLGVALQDYTERLTHLRINDDRIRRPLRRLAVIGRIVLRFLWALILFTLSFPGLILWLPVFASSYVGVRLLKSKTAMADAEVRIAHTKQLCGTFGIFLVVAVSTVYAATVSPARALLVPPVMWMSLRWLEDGVSSFRAFVVLMRLLALGPTALHRLYVARENLRGLVMDFALQELGLPDDPAEFFAKTACGDKRRANGQWTGGMDYFSIIRRRKKDWNEVLRLSEPVVYPEDDT